MFPVAKDVIKLVDKNGKHRPLDEIVEEIIRLSLDRCEQYGDASSLAKELGIGRSTLYRYKRKLEQAE